MSLTLGRMAKLIQGIATLLGVGTAPVAPAAAQSVSPSTAPAEWVAYAENATVVVAGWLQAEDARAQRLRAYLDNMRITPDQLPPALLLKLWIDTGGEVSRIDFAPFAHPEPNADLRAIVLGRRLPCPPPRGMLLPIRLSIQIEPAADEPAP